MSSGQTHDKNSFWTLFEKCQVSTTYYEKKNVYWSGLTFRLAFNSVFVCLPLVLKYDSHLKNDEKFLSFYVKGSFCS